MYPGPTLKRKSVMFKSKSCKSSKNRYRTVSEPPHVSVRNIPRMSTNLVAKFANSAGTGNVSVGHIWLAACFISFIGTQFSGLSSKAPFAP